MSKDQVLHDSIAAVAKDLAFVLEQLAFTNKLMIQLGKVAGFDLVTNKYEEGDKEMIEAHWEPSKKSNIILP